MTELNPWTMSHRADTEVLPLADRHYNRQTPGSPCFTPPGRVLVLKIGNPVNAFWVTNWQEFVDHEWPGAWVCTAFRNEGAGLSSKLILQAVAATRYIYGDPPAHGMVTFVNKRKVKGKKHFGMCFRHAGFKVVGETKVNKLLVLQLLPEDMPEPSAPMGMTMDLFGGE